MNFHLRNFSNLIMPGYDIKTWTSFYKYLQHESNSFENDGQIIIGYMKYLKNVCQIELFNKIMNLDGLYTLYEFTNIALNALSVKRDYYSCEPYKQYQPIKHKRILGMNVIDFYISYDDKRRKYIYGWMSLYYSDEEPELFIAITERDNKSSHPELFGNNSLEAGVTFLKPFEGEDEAWNMNCVWFKFKNMKSFNSCGDIEQQKELLSNFVNEVFDFVTSH